MRKISVEEICLPIDCTGCAACMNICGKSAITMRANEEGFLYPIISADLCVNCGLCKKICPSNNQYEKYSADFFMGWHKHKEVLKHSSSGGAFTAICDYVFDRNGVVFGATKIIDTWEVLHIRVDDKSDIDKLRMSKYYQSNPRMIYKQVKELLESDRFVLFSGTACQIAALYAVLDNRHYHNLITVDVLCHGCVSKKIVDCYISDQERKYKKKIVNFHFRVKDVPWMRGGDSNET